MRAACRSHSSVRSIEDAAFGSRVADAGTAGVPGFSRTTSIAHITASAAAMPRHRRFECVPVITAVR
jgi:hypothetical protein